MILKDELTLIRSDEGLVYDGIFQLNSPQKQNYLKYAIYSKNHFFHQNFH